MNTEKNYLDATNKKLNYSSTGHGIKTLHPNKYVCLLKTQRCLRLGVTKDRISCFSKII